jgi:hypothetical protein
LDPEIEKRCEVQRQDFARRHIQRRHAFTLIWPLVCRRLEARPNLNAAELFDELRTQYPAASTAGSSPPSLLVLSGGERMRRREES